MTNDEHVVYYHRRPDLLWKHGKPLLTSIDIELTERCNNDCIHCCINLPEDDPAERRELSTREWQGVLDQAAELGALTVRFTGGEPLLRPDFTELYLYARRLGLRVLLFTNARLITPELADLFTRVAPREKIQITVYGMKAESYAAVSRRATGFAECRAGIDLLLERKIPFLVKGTVFPDTIDEMEAFIRWASTIPGMDSMPSFPMFLDMRHRRDCAAENKRIRALRLSPEEGLRILTTQPALYRQEMERFCDAFLGSLNDAVFNCNHGNAVCVDAYGKMQFCLGLRDPETTLDIREHDLKEMLTTFIPALRRRVSNRPEFLKRCGRCFLRGLCEQCPAKSWSEHGVLDQPVDYVCEVAHIQARYLGLLKPGEKSWEVEDWQERLAEMRKTVVSKKRI
ncbi:MAG: radical SAM protein [Lentisphaeria bacterium]|nr:radical SAM protein [Lentisphaeria bacterium]